MMTDGRPFALELTIVRGPRRAKLVPAKYNHAVMLETRNVAGQGVRTPRQLLVGLQVAERRGPTLRLGLRQRQAIHRHAAKGQATHAAKSQGDPAAGRHVPPMSGYDIETGEQYSYFCASRLGRILDSRV